MKKNLLILIISCFLFSFIFSNEVSNKFTITRIKYSGGGDWYSDPSSLPNLLDFIGSQTNIKVSLLLPQRLSRKHVEPHFSKEYPYMQAWCFR